MERRFTSSPDQLRLIARENQPTTIAGYGAVFYAAGDSGTEYQLWDDMVERLMPGCFDRAIQEDDVRSLFNHNPDLVLGRNRAETLVLSVDAKGLLYEATPPDTQLVRDQVVAPIGRRDVSGSSFMFEPLKTVWIEEQQDGRSLYIRELHDVRLWEVGPVVFPAYEATTTGVRTQEPGTRGQQTAFLRSEDLDAVRAELKVWLAQRDRQRQEAEVLALHADFAAASERRARSC